MAARDSASRAVSNMAITPPISESALTFTALDIITDALIEVGIQAPGETPDADTGQWAFRKLNYVTDSWSARKALVYASTFATYNMVPGLLPHTIGPAVGATFSVTQRPVKVVRATIILNNTQQPYVEVPITIRDDQWWMENTIKTLQSSQPTDLFYNPAFPNGELYIWPVPNTAYPIRLELWALISQYSSITDPLGGPAGPGSLPPGYRNALMLSLAEELLPGAGKEASPILAVMAARARSAIFNNNFAVPRLQTRDSGVPGFDEGLQSTTFNWKSRSW